MHVLYMYRLLVVRRDSGGNYGLCAHVSVYGVDTQTGFHVLYVIYKCCLLYVKAFSSLPEVLYAEC